MLGLANYAKKMKIDDSDESGQNNDENGSDGNKSNAPVKKSTKMSMRDRLLQNEINDLQDTLPSQCRLRWYDVDVLEKFQFIIKPDEGHWTGGSFEFDVSVPEEYNMMPPKVKCRTRIWHPNITENGSVCLSILRQASIDEQGWNPTRGLRDIVWGVNALFTDLLNFDDPLNGAAATQYGETPEVFVEKVRQYIRQYCVADEATDSEDEREVSLYDNSDD